MLNRESRVVDRSIEGAIIFVAMVSVTNNRFPTYRISLRNRFSSELRENFYKIARGKNTLARFHFTAAHRSLIIRGKKASVLEWRTLSGRGKPLIHDSLVSRGKCFEQTSFPFKRNPS